MIAVSELDRNAGMLFAQALGIKPRSGLVLVLIGKGPATSDELETATDCRQPMVSESICELRQNGYIDFTNNKIPKRRGAPQRVYHCAMPKEELLAKVEENLRTKVLDYNKSIQMLSELRSETH